MNPEIAVDLCDGAIVVDVGAGVLSALGTKLAGKTIHVIACDPLMDRYLEILKEHEIVPRTEVRLAFAEDLSASFASNSVDYVHCMNALDHAFDPLRGIEEMLEIVKPGGVVFLAHRRNEAETEDYSGFHQWNFDKIGDDFVMWNKKSRVCVRDAIGEFATVEVALVDERRAVILKLRKKAEAADKLSAVVTARRAARIEDAFIVLRDVSRDLSAFESAIRENEHRAEGLRAELSDASERSEYFRREHSVAQSQLCDVRAELAAALARVSNLQAPRSSGIVAAFRRLFSAA